MNRGTRSSIAVFAAVLLVQAAAVLHAGQRTPRPSPWSRPADEQIFHRYLDSLAAHFLPAVRSALARIPSPERRLLAMKYYLTRNDSEITAKWAWSSAEIAAFKRSAQYGATRAQLRLLVRSFEERNPGYQLEARMEIRTLADQIHKWNTVATVGAIARSLLDSCRALLADTLAPLDSIPTPAGIERMLGLLNGFEPPQMPSVAVPGLSQHGQIRAFDFRVKRRGRLVAGTSVARIPVEWEGSGWTERLHEAICAVSDSFEGPLTDPYEPWHYAFSQPVLVPPVVSDIPQ